MKTNLDLSWKTDEVLEVEGTWIEASKGVEFKVKRFGGRNALNIKETFERSARGKKTETDDETAKAFVIGCLSDWKGVEANGEPLEFSVDNAVKLLVALPDLSDFLFDKARDMDNFKAEMGND